MLEVSVLFLTAIIVLAVALVVGIIGNIAGIGGGIIIVIFLIYVFKLSPLDAAGLSLLTIVFSSLSGLIQNTRKGLVDMRLFEVVAIAAVIGTIAGSVVTNYISPSTFKGIFSIIVICIGLFSVYSSRTQTRGGIEGHYVNPPHSPDIGALSFIAGLISGFIGIGIGGIMGTYLTAIKRSTPKIAFVSIIAAMFPVTVAGTAIHFYYTGFVNIFFAPPLVIGAVVGGILGSRVISKAPQTSLRFFQGYIIIAFGILSAILYFISFYHI